MRRVIAQAVLLLVGSTASAETVRYEAYRLSPQGAKELIARGTRDYSPNKDIGLADRCGCRAPEDRNRRLPLFGAYSLEVGPPNVDPSGGFGLMIGDGTNQSFSWNWFSPPRHVPYLISLLTGARSDPADVFVISPQNARVKIVTRNAAGKAELASIEFLDDVVLDFTDDMNRHPVKVHSHEFVIVKGSVLRLPENAP